MEAAQAAQRRLASRVAELEGVLRDWGYDEEEDWWTADQATHEAEGPGRLRSGNRMSDQASAGVVHHDPERDDGLSFVGVDAAGDITAVAATVASKAAINASIMAKAFAKLVVPAFPASREMTNWMIALGLVCVCSGGLSDKLDIAWLAECSST